MSDFPDDENDNEENPNPNYPVSKNMVVQPNLDKFVFIRMIKKIGNVEFEDDLPNITLEMDDVLFLPYEKSLNLLEKNGALLT